MGNVRLAKWQIVCKIKALSIYLVALIKIYCVKLSG